MSSVPWISYTTNSATNDGLLTSYRLPWLLCTTSGTCLCVPGWQHSVLSADPPAWASDTSKGTIGTDKEEAAGGSHAAMCDRLAATVPRCNSRLLSAHQAAPRRRPQTRPAHRSLQRPPSWQPCRCPSSRTAAASAAPHGRSQRGPHQQMAARPAGVVTRDGRAGAGVSQGGRWHKQRCMQGTADLSQNCLSLLRRAAAAAHLAKEVVG